MLTLVQVNRTSAVSTYYGTVNSLVLRFEVGFSDRTDDTEGVTIL